MTGIVLVALEVELKMVLCVVLSSKVTGRVLAASGKAVMVVASGMAEKVLSLVLSGVVGWVVSKAAEKVLVASGMVLASTVARRVLVASGVAEIVLVVSGVAEKVPVASGVVLVAPKVELKMVLLGLLSSKLAVRVPVASGKAVIVVVSGMAERVLVSRAADDASGVPGMVLVGRVLIALGVILVASRVAERVAGMASEVEIVLLVLLSSKVARGGLVASGMAGRVFAVSVVAEKMNIF